jgi:hypothetical protein
MPLPARLPRRHDGDAARITLGALFLLVMGAAAHATDCGSGFNVRPQDSVVVISSRPVGCSTDPDRLENGLYAQHYIDTDGDGCREWRETPWRSAISPDDLQTPTIIFIHGNKVSWGETHRRGMMVYHRLTRCAGDGSPIRYVIWAWCADEIKKPIQDYRIKAARTGPVGKQLAWVVNQMPAEARLGIIGYSYGARVASGALQELGSGRLTGPARPVRTVYLAAAFDSDWLGRGCCHGAAMDATDQLLMTVNRRDPAMRFYRFLVKNDNPQALGYKGPTCLDRGRASRVRLVNATDSVGASHDLGDYLCVPGLMAKSWRLLSYADSSGLENSDAPPSLVSANR